MRCGRVAEVPLTPAAGGLLEPAVAVLLLDADADMAGGLVASAAEGHVWKQTMLRHLYLQLQMLQMHLLPL